MGKLALTGGKPVLQPGWKKNWPIITEEDIEAVTGVLRRKNLGGGAGGPEALALEKEWAEYNGVEHSLALNTGTAALHCCISALGIGTGDEVIMPAYTFVASAMAVLHHNAIPVFADIRPDTFCIDTNKIEEKITSKTKAIMPVHVFGQPADMDEIMAIAKKYGLYVIEDACQAQGALYKGQKAGTIGDMSGFSLQTTKNLMCGEGGLLLTKNEELKKKASLTRIFGEYIENEATRDYNSFTVGWNYRMSDIMASLARTQLKRLNEINAVNITNSEYLSKKLKNIPGIIPPFLAPDRKNVFYKYAVTVNPEAMGIEATAPDVRLAFEKALIAEGIPAARWQKRPVPAQDIFQNLNAYEKGCPWSCPHARRGISYDLNEFPATSQVVDSVFMLDVVRAPNGTDLMDNVADAFEKIVENIGEALAYIKENR